jgi:hypothetical protein
MGTTSLKLVQEEFEDTKEVIRIRISKNSQHNVQKKKYKSTNNDLQNIHIKLKIVLDRGLLLSRKLLNQGFLLVKLKSSLRKFYGRHHHLVDSYGISVSQILHMQVLLECCYIHMNGKFTMGKLKSSLLS